MFRELICVSAAVCLGSASSAVAQVPPLEEPGLQQYVGQVIQRNAALAAAGSAQRAAAERIAPAGALPDPVISFGMMSVPVPSFDFKREAMTQLPIGIWQAFPFPGKQAARTAVARADSSVATAGVQLTASSLAARAARAFYELAYARSALDVWRSRLDLAQQATRTATARYETGQAPQTDLLRAEMRRARLVEEGYQFSAEVEATGAEADALRGGPAQPLQVPSLAEPDSAAVLAVLADTVPELDSLRAMLRSANPALGVAAATVERGHATARLFSIAARPDFAAGVQGGIRFGGREPFLSVVVGISVPLWAGRKQTPAARAAGLDLESAEQRYQDLAATLEGELRAELARLDALRQRATELKREVLPLAEAASTSALRSYAVGTVDLTAVLDAQDDLFQMQLRLARLVANYGARRAALGALLGEEWYR